MIEPRAFIKSILAIITVITVGACEPRGNGARGDSTDSETPDSAEMTDDSAVSDAVDLSDGFASAPAAPLGVEATDEMLLARFQAFLDSSVVTRMDSTDAYIGRAERCELDAIIPTTDYLLAAGRALSIRRRGPDSATVRAEIISVGEQRYFDGPDGIQVVVDVDTERVEWEMLRDAEGEWGPCGYASTNRDFGRMGDSGREVRWTPAGASWARIAQLSDSVRRARGLVP